VIQTQDAGGQRQWNHMCIFQAGTCFKESDRIVIVGASLAGLRADVFTGSLTLTGERGVDVRCQMTVTDAVSGASA
jgi:hypothetical protein